MEVIEWIEKTWRISETSQLKILYSLITFLILWTLRKLLVKLVNNKIENVREQYHWRNGVNNAYYIFLIIIISSIWVDKMGSLATFFGLVTAGLAIALQDPIVNVAGWLFILIRKPFEVGDRIQIGDHAGDIIDIRFFQTDVI